VLFFISFSLFNPALFEVKLGACIYYLIFLSLLGPTAMLIPMNIFQSQLFDSRILSYFVMTLVNRKINGRILNK